MTTVLISGANRGVGLEFARQYAADGAQVIAGVRSPSEATDLARIGGVEVFELDVADDASVTAFHKSVGERPVDILIANAGVYGQGANTLGEIDFGVFLRTLDTNALGPLRLAQAFLPNLKAGGAKTFVAITSTMGSTAGHDGAAFAYRASKAALNNVVAGLAKALEKDGIACLPLHPGWVRTDMGGSNAALEPSQSVAGLRARIAEAGPKTSGVFQSYDGEKIAW